MNFIEYGDYKFHGNAAEYGTDGLIMSGSVEQAVSLFGDELFADSLTFRVNSNFLRDPVRGYAAVQDSNGKWLKTSDGKYIVMKIDNPDWREFTYGDPLELYVEEDGPMIGRFYVVNVRQVDRRCVEFNCTDCIGLIDGFTKHNGNIYEGETAAEVFAELFLDTGLMYSVDEAVEYVQVFGRLPRDSRRTNLCKLLVALGAALIEVDGNILITYLGGGSANVIPRGHVYLDAGDVEYRTPATAVQVTEHAFYEIEVDPETLFDNTLEAVADNLLVVFDDPCFDLAVTGSLVIEESNANYAIVSGTGTLTGKPYTHTTRVIERSTGITAAENVKVMEDNELVGAHNSAYVAQRLANYYSVQIGLTGEIYDEEGTLKPSDKVDTVDAFGTERSGWVEKKSFDLGNKTKANVTIAVGWDSGPFGSNYENVDVITADCNWTPPVGCERLRLVVMQGGQGGQNGYKGETSYRMAAGQGGLGGNGGIGGAVFIIDIDNPSGTFAVHIGAGGLPASSTTPGALGQYGEHSTVTNNGTTYTSANGAATAIGFYDILNAIAYATRGAAGLQGSPGGKGSSRTAERGQSFTYGEQTWAGGVMGGGGSNSYGHYGGGGGGGAAYGAAGDRGQDGSPGYYPSPGILIPNDAGDGGDGADALPLAETPFLACGGFGGNGGGGSGGGGYWSDSRAGSAFENSGYGTAGIGGAPSKGTAGGQGCVLIYY